MSDLTGAYHIDTTTKETRLLMVDNLYNEMNVLGGVKDCTAHDRLKEIADAWVQEFSQCKLYKASDGMCIQCVEYLHKILTREVV